MAKKNVDEYIKEINKLEERLSSLRSVSLEELRSRLHLEALANRRRGLGYPKMSSHQEDIARLELEIKSLESKLNYSDFRDLTDEDIEQMTYAEINFYIENCVSNIKYYRERLEDNLRTQRGVSADTRSIQIDDLNKILENLRTIRASSRYNEDRAEIQRQKDEKAKQDDERKQARIKNEELSAMRAMARERKKFTIQAIAIVLVIISFFLSVYVMNIGLGTINSFTLVFIPMALGAFFILSLIKDDIYKAEDLLFHFFEIPGFMIPIAVIGTPIIFIIYIVALASISGVLALVYAVLYLAAIILTRIKHNM